MRFSGFPTRVLAGGSLAALSLVAFAQNTANLPQTAVDAYTYVYPLVSMDVARRQATNVESADKPGFAPVNTFQHVRCYNDPAIQEAPRANLDMLPSRAWVDLSNEPVVLSVPDAGGRSYALSLADMWSETFASVGPRSLGDKAANVVIVPPNWKGKLPKEVERLDSPHIYALVSGQTRVNGPDDCGAANALQDGYKLTPLSRWIKPVKQPAKTKFVADPQVDMNTPPLDQVRAMPIISYFKYASQLLQTHKTNLSDGTMQLRMKALGVEAGKNFEPLKLNFLEQDNTKVEIAPPAHRAMQLRNTSATRVVNRWAMPSEITGAYGNNYLRRAAVVQTGFGVPQPEDMVSATLTTDHDGQELTSERRYLLRFKKDALPPAEYWTITLYDANGRPVPNSANRAQIGAATGLQKDNDGIIDVYLQQESPGSSRAANWLPTPKKGAFVLVLRAYGAQPELLEERWQPPTVQQVSSYGYNNSY